MKHFLLLGAAVRRRRPVNVESTSSCALTVCNQFLPSPLLPLEPLLSPMSSMDCSSEVELMSDSDESVDEIAQLLEAELQQTTTCDVKNKQELSLSIQQHDIAQITEQRDLLQQQKSDCGKVKTELQKYHVASQPITGMKFDPVKLNSDIGNQRALSESCCTAALTELPSAAVSNCNAVQSNKPQVKASCLLSNSMPATTNKMIQSVRMESADCRWTADEVQLVLSDVISQTNECGSSGTETQQAQPETLQSEIKTEFGRNIQNTEVVKSPSRHLANTVIKEEQSERTLNLQETSELRPETVTRFSEQIKFDHSSSASLSNQPTVVDASNDVVTVVEQGEFDTRNTVSQPMPLADCDTAVLQRELTFSTTAVNSPHLVQGETVEDSVELTALETTAFSQNEIMGSAECELTGLPAVCKSEVPALMASQCQTLIQAARPEQQESAADVALLCITVGLPKEPIVCKSEASTSMSGQNQTLIQTTSSEHYVSAVDVAVSSVTVELPNEPVVCKSEAPTSMSGQSQTLVQTTSSEKYVSAADVAVSSVTVELPNEPVVCKSEAPTSMSGQSQTLVQTASSEQYVSAADVAVSSVTVELPNEPVVCKSEAPTSMSGQSQTLVQTTSSEQYVSAVDVAVSSVTVELPNEPVVCKSEAPTSMSGQSQTLVQTTSSEQYVSAADVAVSSVTVELPNEPVVCKSEAPTSMSGQSQTLVQTTSSEQYVSAADVAVSSVTVELPNEPVVCKSEAPTSMSGQSQTLVQTTRSEQHVYAADVAQLNASSLTAMFKLGSGSAKSVEEMELAATVESIELELASEMLEGELLDPSLPADTFENSFIPSAVAKTESQLETESTENVSSVIAGNKALHLTAEGIVQQVELPPMISVIITPVKPSHCSISKNRVECSQNVDSLQSEQAPDVFMSTKQSHRSASECSRDVVSMLSEYAPDDRTSVEQCHRSTSETKVECSGNTVSLRALDDRISSTIKSTETEVPSPLGNQCKPLAVNSVGSIAHENLCTSSSSVKLPLPDDRVTLKFPSIAAILEECTFDIPLLSPIKDPPWLVEQDKNAVDLKSEAIQLKSEYCDVSKEVPGLSLSTTSNTLSSGSRQQQHQTKKRKSNGKASVDEARCSIAKKPCMTTVQEVSSSPIISHPVVSVASGCTTSAWPRASNTRVDMTDSPASPDATDVQPVVSRTSLNQMGTSSIVTLSSSGRHGHFVVSTASNEALKSCVNLPPRQEAVATAVAVKCSQSTCYVPPCHSGEVAKPEPRESSAKIGQCNNGEIAKTTVICKTLRLAMEFDSTESNIAVNLAKLQPTTATVATAFTQAVTETATDLMPVWNARCQMLSHAADTPWLSDTDRKLLRLLLTCSKFFDTLTEEFLLRVEVLMSKVTGNVGPVAIQRAALSRLFTAICRLQGNIERVRVLVFDAIKMRRAANLHVLVSVAGVWPQVLDISGVSTSNMEQWQPVLAAMEYIVCTKEMSVKAKKKAKVAELKLCLNKFCGWETKGNTLCQMMVWLMDWLRKQLSATVCKPNILPDCVLDVQLGLELISVHEDWKWVKVAILDKTLVPVLDSWLSSTSRHVEDPLYKEHVVGLIGCVLSRCPNKDQYTDGLLTKLSTLMHSFQVSETVQMAALRSMLACSSLLNPLYAGACLEWVKRYNGQYDCISEKLLISFCKRFPELAKT